MNVSPKFNPDKKDLAQWARDAGQEFRLGLVLYGGISLAIYENGVAQELYRAVRGLGMYGALKQYMHADVVVDIVSGTSAGGINGLMLGYALANGRDFRATGDLWRFSGDFGKLLRTLDDRNEDSILNSRGYYQPQLERAFQSMPEQPHGGWPSTAAELDVFVTGTNAYGKIWTVFDDKGDAIDLKDHHALFQLCYRADPAGGAPRKNDFDTGQTYAVALGKLSRITSAFPVAFEPVAVPALEDEQPSAEEQAADRLLDRWGWLNVPNRQTDRAYFLDGGLLENKPFTSTLNAMFRRTSDRPSTRYLFYVEPDPERFRPIPSPQMPNVAATTFDALIGIPGYQGIGGDLQSIARHNDGVTRHRAMVEQVRRETADLPNPRQSLAAFEDTAHPSFELYKQCRLVRLRDRAVEGILKIRGNREWLRGKARAEARALVAAFDRSNVLGDRQLEEYDVYYRLRRAARLIYFTLEYPLAESAEQTRLLDVLNLHFQTIEVVEAAMEDLIDQAEIFKPVESIDERHPRARDSYVHEGQMEGESEADGDISLPPPPEPTEGSSGPLEVDAAEVWARVEDLLNALLRQSTILIPGDDAGVNAFAAELKAAKESLLAKSGKAVESATGDNLLTMLDTWLTNAMRDWSQRAPNLWREYRCFLETDVCLFPTEFDTPDAGHDMIHTVRISPYDVKYGLTNRETLWSGQIELAGAQLAHFGGFLKRSWRSNDILWGRLDAASILLECMLGRTRTPEEIQQVVLKMQSEILAEALPDVIEDEAGEQIEWNRYVSGDRVRKPESDLPLKVQWKAGREEITPTVGAMAAKRLADAEMERLQKGGIRKFFLSRYKVGEERWQVDIPKRVLLNRVAQTGIRLNWSLLNTLGNTWRPRIENSAAYRALIKAPLWLLYKFTRGRGSWSRRFLAGLGSGVLAGAILLAVLAYWLAGSTGTKAAFVANLSAAAVGAIAGAAVVVLSLLLAIGAPIRDK